jgi:hypothetical protein
MRSTGQMMKQPKRWWFALPLPAALLVGLVAWSARLLAQSPELTIGGVCETLGQVAVFGGPTFPVGLFAWVIWSSDAVAHHWMSVCAVGWLLYLSLIVAGLVRPGRGLFVVLCVLLVLNVGGCHLPQSGAAIIGTGSPISSSHQQIQPVAGQPASG